jgi:hypothetical protein
MELILTDIELADNTTNDNTFDVWYSNKTFIAIENVKGGRTFKYKFKLPLLFIAKNHAKEILEYRLGKVTPQDELSIGDIFMHGKFIEKIS